MEKLLIELMNEYGYVAILFSMLVENVFPPIPSEFILSFAGFFTTTTSLSIPGVVLFSTIGSTIGSIFLYGLGYIFPIEKVAKWLKIKQETMERMEIWFDKHSVKAVFLCRFIPLLRSLISLPAGMMKLNIGVFIIFTALGSLIWNSVLIMIGAFLGESWEIVLPYFQMYSTIFYGMIAFVLMIWILFALKKEKS